MGHKNNLTKVEKNILFFLKVYNEILIKSTEPSISVLDKQNCLKT